VGLGTPVQIPNHRSHVPGPQVPISESGHLSPGARLWAGVRAQVPGSGLPGSRVRIPGSRPRCRNARQASTKMCRLWLLFLLRSKSSRKDSKRVKKNRIQSNRESEKLQVNHDFVCFESNRVEKSRIESKRVESSRVGKSRKELNRVESKRGEKSQIESNQAAIFFFWGRSKSIQTLEQGLQPGRSEFGDPGPGSQARHLCLKARADQGLDPRTWTSPGDPDTGTRRSRPGPMVQFPGLRTKALVR
jgi:hypothetical protein